MWPLCFTLALPGAQFNQQPQGWNSYQQQPGAWDAGGSLQTGGFNQPSAFASSQLYNRQQQAPAYNQQQQGFGGFSNNGYGQPQQQQYAQPGGFGQQPPLRPMSVAPLGSNPFESGHFYVNSDYQTRVRSSMQARWAEGHTRTEMSTMLSVPSAFWVDRISKIRRSTAGAGAASLESILDDAAAQSPPPLVVAILYDLPNRDCHAYASNGEICCEYQADGTTCNYETRDGTCRVGLAKYQSEYVDGFVAVLAAHASVPTVVIVEPDSLPNLATNLANPRCGNDATGAAYKQGVCVWLLAESPLTLHVRSHLNLPCEHPSTLHRHRVRAISPQYPLNLPLDSSQASGTRCTRCTRTPPTRCSTWTRGTAAGSAGPSRHDFPPELP